MTNNTPSGAKKHCKSTEPESCQTAKMFFFFFFFRRGSSSLRDSFTMVFVQNSSIFNWAVHQALACVRILSLKSGWNHSQNYGFLWDAFFLHVYTCAQSLSNEMWQSRVENVHYSVLVEITLTSINLSIHYSSAVVVLVTSGDRTLRYTTMFAVIFALKLQASSVTPPPCKW